MRKTGPERPGGWGGFLLVAILSVAAIPGPGIAEAASTMANVTGNAVAPPGGFKWKDGEEVYGKVCGYCHEGGKVGPLILGRALPPAYVQMVVRNGNRAMPAFRASEIDDESLRKLADFIFHYQAGQ